MVVEGGGSVCVVALWVLKGGCTLPLKERNHRWKPQLTEIAQKMCVCERERKEKRSVVVNV